MNNMNPKVDIYFAAGCGRCPLGNTPECKVHNWRAELEQLRSIILECGLSEELKWGVPVYTFQNNNVLLIGAFNEYCVISFFKGALLKDAEGILRKPGENTQAGRVVKFTNIREVIELETVIKSYIYEAIEVEKAGLKVEMKKTSDFEMPAEFTAKLEENAALNSAFYKLTPGRQRGYILYFSAAKQSKTREARIEKSLPHILMGRGLNDR